MIYGLQFAKKCTFDEKPNALRITCAWLLFICLVVGVYAFCSFCEKSPKFDIDYKFYGCILPVFASLFDFRRIPVLCMAIPIALVSFFPDIPILRLNSPLQSIMIYSLLAIPILLLYNGQKGKVNMKYFFYIFYPLHLGLLEGIYLAMLYL